MSTKSRSFRPAKATKTEKATNKRLVQRIEIPIPPSANALWMIGRVKGRPCLMKTPEYTTWILTAGMKMRMGLAKCKALPVRIRVEIHAGQGFPESRDLDNCIKPIADAVRASKILPDDRVTEISKIDLEYIRRHRATGIATCWVEIEELGDCVQGELFDGDSVQ